MRLKKTEWQRSSCHVYWYKVFGGDYASQIGCYMVAFHDLMDMVDCTVKLCVVDDFGNLVGVA